MHLKPLKHLGVPKINENESNNAGRDKITLILPERAPKANASAKKANKEQCDKNTDCISDFCKLTETTTTNDGWGFVSGECAPKPASSGGARQKKSIKKKPVTHQRTKRKHTCKDGRIRTIYTTKGACRKDGKDYVMRKSKKTGKMRFEKEWA